MKIAIVDDEALLVKGIRFNLQNDGYEILTGSNGLDALEYARDPEVGLIILDVMMPEMDGLTACSRIREFSQVPILMLTAKTEDMDKLMGFDHGADDYLTKPFNILELKARVRALLRRSGMASKPSKPREDRLTIGSISLDLAARNAYKGDRMVDLTAKEFDVIEFLMRNPNHVYSREALLDTLWAYEYRSEIRTVDVHIRRLREKLEDEPAQPKYIMTKWGVGYYFKR